MSLLLVLFAAYASVSLLAMVLVHRVVADKALFRFFSFVILTTPIVAVATLLYALCGGRLRYSPVSEELATIEQEIEAERISQYGGTPIKPSFAEAMKIAYLKSLSGAAKTADFVSGSKFHDMVPAVR